MVAPSALACHREQSAGTSIKKQTDSQADDEHSQQSESQFGFTLAGYIDTLNLACHNVADCLLSQAETR